MALVDPKSVLDYCSEVARAGRVVFNQQGEPRTRSIVVINSVPLNGFCRNAATRSPETAGAA